MHHGDEASPRDLVAHNEAAPIVYFRPKEMEPAPEGSPQLEAPGNWFSVNNEMKLLPEVMSKFTFEVRDHAAPVICEAEEELR